MKGLAKKVFVAAIIATLLGNAAALSACGHTHTPGNEVKENEIAATCTQNGSYDAVIYCSDCNEVMSRTPKIIDKLGHAPSSPIKENQSAVSCTADGSYDEVVYCADCNAEISRTRKTEKATGHTPAEAVTENERLPSCAEAGGYDQVIYCEVCKNELDRVSHTVDRLPHRYTEELFKDKTGHWYQCVNCGDKKDFAAHVPGPEATETVSQLCTVCGYVIAAPVGHVHVNHLLAVAAKAAGCLTAGNIAYYVCSCGNWYEDQGARNVIDNHDSVILPATGHSYDSKWSQDDTFHWHAANCEHTGESTGKAAHVYNDGVVNDSKKVYTCTICGHVKQTEMYTVIFHYNYPGSPPAISVLTEENSAVKEPALSRAEYAVTDWYTDAACTVKYDIEASVTADLELYAGWRQTAATVIEAEYVNLAGINGVGYSSETRGVGMIQRDIDGAADASNGFFLGYLYKNGTTITFKFNSSEETDHATVKLRLSGEVIPVLSFTCDEFIVKVNGDPLAYDAITIADIDPDMSKETKRKFQDFTVGIGVHLQKGENVMTFTVNNFNGMGGNMRSTAPLVDCVKIYSDTDIDYEPLLSNLDRFKN